MMTALETPGCICGKPVPRTDYETGETGCGKCGQVLGTIPDAPHTADNLSIVPNRAHATEMHGGSASLKRAVKISQKTDTIGVSVNFTIKAGCDKLGLPRSVEQRSVVLFSKSRHMLKGRAKENVGAASIYMACREHSIPRILKDVCGMMGAHHKRTKRAYRAMCEAIGQKLPVMSPTGLITKMVSDLGLSEQFSRQVLDTCAKIYATGCAEGKSPTMLSACAIYMTAKPAAANVTMKKICGLAGITEAGLRNNVKLFREKFGGGDGGRAGRRVKQTAAGSMIVLEKGTLYKMYVKDKMTIKQIGHALDCNPLMVGRKLAEYGIEKRQGCGRATVEIPKDELERLFVAERRTIHDIAKEYGCSACVVRRFLAKHGIDVSASRMKILLPFDTLWKMRVEDGLSLKEMAERLECCITTVRKNMQHHGIKVKYASRTKKAGQAA